VLVAVMLVPWVAQGQGVTNLDAQISARTRIIESRQSTRDEQLDAQAERGVLFRKTGRFDLAIVDLTEVLRSRPQADDVQERFLPAHSADGGPVIGVEVAMDRYAARLSESDRLLDLPALEVALLAHARD